MVEAVRGRQGAARRAGCACRCLRRALTLSGDRLLRILARFEVGRDGRAGPSERLCAVCVEVVGLTGGGVMLMSDDVARGSVCSSNEVSALIEELQFTLGEGP